MDSTLPGGSPRFGRVETSILGESALIDRETGRVYWECGNSNTLYESLTPKLDQFGLEHAQATFLTILITLAFLSVVSGWLERAIIGCCRYDRTAAASVSSSLFAAVPSILVLLAEKTILRLPKIENKWWMSTIVALYFFESYQCSTRCFLANAVSSATELDAYIDGLKHEPPVVTWTVQTFHYELCRLLAVPRMFRSFLRNLKNSKRLQKDGSVTPESDPAMDTAPVSEPQSKPLSGLELSPRRSSRHTAPVFLLTRKVVTNEVSVTYRYSGCVDETTTGVWSRALVLDDDARVPFRKISLSKVLVLADKKSREDYFRQQSEFVTRYGREDEFAEFSTSIDVAGYRPRLWVAQSDGHRRTGRGLARLSVYWAFTCLGFTVPYRVWFKRRCDFWRVTVVKETSSEESNSGGYLRNWFPSRASLRLTNKGVV
mmetsp:Transcript_16006/g.37078  ORF Transcript_16006/g.37078 Transcript_16006/m.37078 type:complete len:431 (-) Transcript_16006:572-1864(-)